MTRYSASLVLLLGLLVACSPQTPAPRPTPTPVAEPTSSPTPTTLPPTLPPVNQPAPTTDLSPAPTSEPSLSIVLIARLGEGAMTGADLSPDRQSILIARAAGIGLYTTDSFNQIWWMPTPEVSASSVRFSPGGTLFAAGMVDGSVLICQIRSPECQSWVTARAPADGFNLVDWSSDSQYISIETSETQRVLKFSDASVAISENRNYGNRRSMAWSPAGARIAITWRNGITVNDPATGDALLTLDGSSDENTFFEPPSWSPDGKYIFAYPFIFDAETGKQLPELKSIETPGGAIPVKSRLFDLYSENDERVLAGGLSTDNTAYLSFMRSGGLIRTDLTTRAESTVATFDAELFKDLIWSPDSKRLATISYDDGVSIWDAATSTILNHLDLPKVYRAEWSPDGRLLALGTASDVILFDTEANKVLHTFHGYNEGEYDFGAASLAFSPDGKMLATGVDNRAVLWSVETGEKVFELGEHPEPVVNVDWSPDGRMVADADRQILYIWGLDQLPIDVESKSWTLAPVSLVNGHPALFSPTGDHVALSIGPYTHPETLIRRTDTFQTIQRFNDVVPIKWLSDTTVFGRNTVYPHNKAYTLDITTGWQEVATEFLDISATSPDLKYGFKQTDSGGQVLVEIATSRHVEVPGMNSPYYYRVSWSPDSHHVVFLTSLYDDGRIMVFSVN